jgi:hypothetical protein
LGDFRKKWRSHLAAKAAKWRSHSRPSRGFRKQIMKLSTKKNSAPPVMFFRSIPSHLFFNRKRASFLRQPLGLASVEAAGAAISTAGSKFFI